MRFRTAIKDSRDTIYIFWTIVVGICCGAGDYRVAAVGSAFVFTTILVFGRIKNDNRMLLVIRVARPGAERAKNTSRDSVEYIYELSRKKMDAVKGMKKDITDAIYEIGGVEYFNIVAQNDEISS